MSATENIQSLERELENTRQDLRETVTEINHKVKETRARLSPTAIVQQRPLWFLGLSMLLGLVLGYRGVPIEKVGVPAARTLLNTAGKRAAMRAVG
ncbi:MAG: hypothetical protein IVW54_17670 [Candidatus Binataceae bacterium]|nr:hypothetical protein [Candidatus Binataceae bacterium]